LIIELTIFVALIVQVREEAGRVEWGKAARLTKKKRSPAPYNRAK
jgi:hypothetical protein